MTVTSTRAERAGGAVEQVDQPPRGSDDDVDAAGELVDLPADGGAAVNGRHAQADRMGERGEHGGDLTGKLAGGHQHQPARRLGPAWPRGRGEAGEHGQAERERLTRPGLRAAEDVAAGQRVGHGRGLDREWRRNSTSGQRGHQGCGNAEVGERGGGRDRRVERGGKRAVQVGLLALARYYGASWPRGRLAAGRSTALAGAATAGRLTLSRLRH